MKDTSVIFISIDEFVESLCMQCIRRFLISLEHVKQYYIKNNLTNKL